MGSSAAGCSCHTSPSMRTVKVSGSTSMRGSRVVERHLRPCRRRGRCRTGDQPAVDREPVGQAVLDRLRGDEVHRGRRGRGGRGTEHRPRQHRLRRGDRGVGVAHRGPGDHAALEHRVRAHPEEGRLPQHQVGELADLDRTDLVVEAVRDRRADGVLRDVAADPVVVGPRRRRPPARRGGASSRARSARCASPPRRCGPSPARRCRSSRWRRCRAAGPRRRWSTAGSGSRRTPDPRGRWG